MSKYLLTQQNSKQSCKKNVIVTYQKCERKNGKRDIRKRHRVENIGDVPIALSC